MFFTRKLTVNQLQERIDNFDKQTAELKTKYTALIDTRADLLAKQAVGENAGELDGVTKQATKALTDIEGRDLAWERLTAELVEVERRERLADFAKEKKRVEAWLRDRAAAGERLGEAIRALGKALAAVEQDRIPPGVVFKGMKFGSGGVSLEMEVLNDATKFEPPLSLLAEGIKIIGGVDGGDRFGRKHPYVDHARIKQAAIGAERTGDRLREMTEVSMARHEAELES